MEGKLQSARDTSLPVNREANVLDAELSQIAVIGIGPAVPSRVIGHSLTGAGVRGLKRSRVSYSVVGDSLVDSRPRYRPRGPSTKTEHMILHLRAEPDQRTASISKPLAVANKGSSVAAGAALALAACDGGKW